MVYIREPVVLREEASHETVNSSSGVQLLGHNRAIASQSLSASGTTSQSISHPVMVSQSMRQFDGLSVYLGSDLVALGTVISPSHSISNDNIPCIQHVPVYHDFPFRMI